jgi:predicted enzyme related to lactoylglutathione lyase
MQLTVEKLKAVKIFYEDVLTSGWQNACMCEKEACLLQFNATNVKVNGSQLRLDMIKITQKIKKNIEIIS